MPLDRWKNIHTAAAGEDFWGAHDGVQGVIAAFDQIIGGNLGNQGGGGVVIEQDDGIHGLQRG